MGLLPQRVQEPEGDDGRLGKGARQEDQMG